MAKSVSRGAMIVKDLFTVRRKFKAYFGTDAVFDDMFYELLGKIDRDFIKDMERAILYGKN